MGTDIKALEATLRSSIGVARALGWTLTRDITVDSERRLCCALGAVLVDRRGVPADTSDLQVPGNELGLQRGEADAFACGFDGDEARCLYDHLRVYHALGKRLGEELLGAR
jgi:hypothetical protein